MKLKEVLYNAARYLALDSLVTAMDSQGTLVGQEKVMHDDLVRCINLAAGDLAMGKIPISGVKTVASVNGYIPYLLIDEGLTEVISVVGDDGKKVKFTPYSDRVLVEDGVYTISYRFLPDKMGDEDELPFSRQVCEKALLYGAACEFCIAYGRNNEAVKWENLYVKETAKSDERKSYKGVYMSARRWY